jgi:hypothetical protein
MSITDAYLRIVKQRVAALPDAQADKTQMNEVLRLMGRWRSELLANTYVAHHGAVVYAGPFKGMQFQARTSEGAGLPRLLGLYEFELQPFVTRFMAEPFECVIDVGCADGYYAIGLARGMPQTVVHAYDINPDARIGCAALAEANGVADRVVVGELFKPERFAEFAGKRTLVIVDIEGAEADLLDPEASPALKGMSLIVETHDCFRPGALKLLSERFAASHDIVRVDAGPRPFDLPPFFNSLPHLDHVLALWEWRGNPTPWLVMTPKE